MTFTHPGTQTNYSHTTHTKHKEAPKEASRATRTRRAAGVYIAGYFLPADMCEGSHTGRDRTTYIPRVAETFSAKSTNNFSRAPRRFSTPQPRPRPCGGNITRSHILTSRRTSATHPNHTHKKSQTNNYCIDQIRVHQVINSFAHRSRKLSSI